MGFMFSHDITKARFIMTLVGHKTLGESFCCVNPSDVIQSATDVEMTRKCRTRGARNGPTNLTEVGDSVAALSVDEDARQDLTSG